ncbi:hypothetical protein FO519_007834 [Halicephalobus sp. NKZ332]|nr:hypothetical protein FO519_007834 [Halicephalobus sp. NKZ332]
MEEKGLSNLFNIEIDASAKVFRYHIDISITNRAGISHSLTGGEETARKERSENLLKQSFCYDFLSEVLYQTKGFSSNPGEEPSFIYDCKSILYASRYIQCEVEDFIYPREQWRQELRESCPHSSFTMHINFSKPIILDLNDPCFFEEPNDSIGREDRELRSFFELLTNQPIVDDNNGILRTGQVFFKSECVETNLGISFYQGIKKQCRLVTDRGRIIMKLVVDPVISPFYTGQSLSDSMMEFFSVKGLSDESVQMFHNVYLSVGLIYHMNRSKVIILRELSSVPLKDLYFIDEDKKEISVVQYYKKQYGIVLKALDYPAVVVRRNDTALYFPPEVLDIIPKCVCKENLEIVYPSDYVLRMNAMEPQNRMALTQKSLAVINEKPSFFKAFGVSINPNSNIVGISKATPPTVKYKNNVNRPDERTRFRVGEGFVDSATPPAVWHIVYGSDVSANQARDLCNRVRGELARHGRGWPEAKIVPFETVSEDSTMWGNLFSALLAQKCEFVFFLDRASTRSHHIIKFCERYFNLLTQHIQVETMNKLTRFYNPVAKTNCKKGGLNYEVVPADKDFARMFNEDKVFIIGYDVAHSTFSVNGYRAPSVVGVSFNAGAQIQAFIGDYFYQDPLEENVDTDQLAEVIYRALKTRIQMRPKTCAPELIIVYRDGLREGQFAMALNNELRGIMNGFRRNYPNFIPQILFVVATKNHNRRFYTMNGRNLAPGSVIRDGAARAFSDEFYMQSAYPLKGTGKATDYEILKNPTNLSSKTIVDITFALCFEHQIVNSATSQPTPAYLAHELTRRGSNNLKVYTKYYPSDEPPDLKALNGQLSYASSPLGFVRFNA